jgi:hypothetical protein
VYNRAPAGAPFAGQSGGPQACEPHQPTGEIMNKDQVKGRAERAKGKFKEVAGKDRQ